MGINKTRLCSKQRLKDKIPLPGLGSPLMPGLGSLYADLSRALSAPRHNSFVFGLILDAGT